MNINLKGIQTYLLEVYINNYNILILIIYYMLNIIKDIIYGYIQVKCANPYCSNIFKIPRNDYNNTLYSCNMGCALNAYNTKTNESNF